MKRSTPIAVSKWMWCLSRCQAQGLVIVKKKHNPGRRCLDRENKKKRCIVPIKNRDALCCARAIVTMRAHCHKDQGVDGFRQWDNLKRGRPVQQHQAQELHRQAGVTEGPCGLKELRQFEKA